MKTKIYVNTKTIKISEIEALKLNKGDQNVYEYLFSTKYNVNNYGDLPEEIQTTVTLVKPLFYDLEVWTSDRIADPLLVGVKKKITFSKDFPDLGYNKGELIISNREQMDKIKKSGLVEGYNNDYTSYSDDELFYLIAQWGAEIFPIDELKQKAMKLKRDERLVQLTKKKNQIQTALDLIDVEVEQYFNGYSRNLDIF